MTDDKRVRLGGKEKIMGGKSALTTHLIDLIIYEEAVVACAKRRDALCFIRFFLEQILAPSLKNLREDFERRQILKKAFGKCYSYKHLCTIISAGLQM